ncbi:MAG TPA: CusA/CzcA family heavy metal efflux RND transporter [Vicinamibacterales bacterium]|jgi:Cu(I)/Ag(I) efflux system membrane protein CusA/SilA|nr:CusA/CzcA family heavy metal efflux RND transporter [Vicinamibacterales bacterium]
MINRIIDFSARNRVLVVAIAIAAAMGGWWSMRRVALDALPDLGDTQVIVYSQWDRSPDVVEDQVTYPIVTALLGAPRVKAVRGFSDFGSSFVYVVFEDGTDIYWARSRTTEYLSAVLSRLPAGVKTALGPDANGLGWVFQYVLVDESSTHTLAELRSFQDWHVRYSLKSVRGVADVASVGGYVRQYQVNVDPDRLRAHALSIAQVVDAVRGGNSDVGGRVIEFGGTEYMVRGRGYAQSIGDFENIVLSAGDSGTAVRVKDVGEVVLGPDLRRGVADLDGAGDAVSGIVIMRHGENALEVIDRVKAKLHDIERTLPRGVKIVPIYDRGDLIRRSIDNVTWTLIEIMITVAAVILLFLWHIPSALIPVITIPIAVLISFIPFRMLGITANIMSLGGIAIAVGALVDASIVVVEQAHKKLERWQRTDRHEEYASVIVAAVKEVGGASFFALLLIAVSFLPVLTLEAQEGRLFRPLAYTKSLAMVVAAVLAITLDPALRLLLTHVNHAAGTSRTIPRRIIDAVLVGTIHPEETHPVSRVLIRIYEPVVRWALRRNWLVIASACVIVVATVPVYTRLGSEFMPPLDEGSLLYMPSTMPGISIAEAQKVLQLTDRIIKEFPEVDRVLGKAGRADTPTDPAPPSMLETVITLRPRSEWRKVETWYSSWAPAWAAAAFRRITPDTIAHDDLVDQLNAALQLPGLSNAWTMPVKARTAMLTTGVRTPIGVKVSGSDLRVIERVGAEIQTLLQTVEGTRSVFAERTGGGYFLDVGWKREELARYGLSLDDAQAVVQHAIGGEMVTTAIEGRERYPVNVRYMADFRTDLEALGQVAIPASDGQRQIPLAQLATIRTLTGPSMIRNEDGLLTGYVYVDLADRDPGGYVAEAARVLDRKLTLPTGYSISWSGQYEAMQRVKERLTVIVPLTVLAIFILLYINTGSLWRTAIVGLAMPFSAVGAIWMLYLLDYNMSVGVWVGLIALLGVDAETGVFMLLYLDLAYEEAKKNGRLHSLGDLQQAIVDGAVKRLRPKIMTVATMFIGLVPIMWAVGTGSDVMKRIAAPMIGGIVTSFLLELVIYPPLYQLCTWNAIGARRITTPGQPE